MERILLYFVCTLAGLYTVSCLECYSCDKQEHNDGDCENKIQTCNQFQDACTTYVRWAVRPNWSPRGDRIHEISKACDTRKGCEGRQHAIQSHCNRDMYNDWACAYCCTGDLCNYYVHLGSGTVKSSVMVLTAASTLTILYMWL